MKKTLLRSFLLAGVTFGMTTIGYGQTVTTQSGMHPRVTANQPTATIPGISNERHSPSTIVYTGSNPLPSVVAVAGADKMPITGNYQLHTNGRPGHNIMVDPANPNFVHAVAMMTTINTPADTTAGSPSRRLFYTFSNDAGATWSAAKILGDVRTGFPYMILVNRGGKNVPIIGAHRETATGSNKFVSEIFVEQGDPGAGNFTEVQADRNSIEGGEKDLIWPVIAASPDGSSIYMIADEFGTASSFYEFGKFTKNGSGAYVWGGWKVQPGADNAGFPSAGFASGGENIMYVAPTGEIGILWQTPDNAADGSLYFIVSTDEGQTWPQNFDPFYAPGDFQTIGNTQAQNAAFNTYDFFWTDKGPTIMWLTAFQDLPNNTYFPNAMSLFVYNPELMTSVSPVGALTGSQFLVSDFAMSWNPRMSNSNGQLSFPVLAHTDDPAKFAIFFQTYVGDDSVVVGPLVGDPSGEDKTFLFGSVYMTETIDAGVTWTEPKAVRTNIHDENNPQPIEQKIDYRFPDASTWNPLSGNNPQYHIMFMADSAAGYLARNGLPGFDEVGFFHQVVGKSGVDGTEGMANSLDLEQNYPNPFNPSTTIRFAMEKSGYATLEVRDMLGRTVATIINGFVPAGAHTESFDAKGLTTGIYEYTLTANGESVSRRMILNK